MSEIQLTGGPVFALFFIGLGVASILFAGAFYLAMRGYEIGRQNGLWR